MKHKTNKRWLWLAMIGGGFTALALGATFTPGLLNQRIAESPATWGLAASAFYLVFVIGIMGLATRPFDRSDEEADQ